MGKYDDTMYRYMKDSERFTELINAAVFKGKQVLKPEMLESDDGRYVAMKESQKGKLHSFSRFRDIKKRTKDGVFLSRDRTVEGTTKSAGYDELQRSRE